MSLKFVIACMALFVVVATAHETGAHHEHNEPHHAVIKAQHHGAQHARITEKQALAMIHRLMVVSLLNNKTGADPQWLRAQVQGQDGSLPCYLCEKAVGFLIGKGNSFACGWAFDGLALAACEAAGLGPEDPLSDVCTAALIGGCGIILKDIENHITNAQQICSDIHLC